MSKENDRINNLYLSGKTAKAIEAWKVLANTGDAEAMSYLGGVYFEDLGDIPESIVWYKAAEAAGDIESGYYLAISYLEVGDNKNAEAAFKRSLRAGMSQAVLDLATFYIEKLNSTEKAEEALLNQATAGFIPAAVYLVDVYLSTGKSSEVDKWMGHVKENGSKVDLAALARVLKKHNQGEAQNEMLELAAEKGDVRAQAQLLRLAEKFENQQKLMNLLEKFCTQNNKVQNYSLATSLDQGEIAKKTGYSVAAEYIFTKLAQQDHKNSFLRLANLILRGPSEDKKARALPWFIKAAERGSRPAQVKLLFLALEIDDKETFEKWFPIALETGVPGQDVTLGNSLLQAGQKNYAFQCYQFALDKGYEMGAPPYYIALSDLGDDAEMAALTKDKAFKSPAVQIRIGQLLMAREKHDEALIWLEKSLPEKIMWTKLYMARCYEALGETKKVVETIESTESTSDFSDSNNDYVLYQFAEVYFEVGDIERAIKMLHEFDSRRKEASTLELLGSILLKASRIKDAKSAWSKAIKRGSGLANYHLANLEATQGNLAKAEKHISDYFDSEISWSYNRTAVSALLELGSIEFRLGDEQQGVDHWSTAARCGHPLAALNYGIYISTSDSKESKNLLEYAAENGVNPQAQDMSALVFDSKMLPKDSNWLKRNPTPVEVHEYSKCFFPDLLNHEWRSDLDSGDPYEQLPVEISDLSN